MYEDSLTGATIALPQGMQTKLDPQTHMLTAKAAAGNLTLSFQIAKKGGKNASRVFETGLKKGRSWKNLPVPVEETIKEEDDIQVEKSLYSGDDPENPSQTLSYSATMDGDEENFLGAAVLANHPDQLSPGEKRTLLIMEVCVELAGFRLD